MSRQPAGRGLHCQLGRDHHPHGRAPLIQSIPQVYCASGGQETGASLGFTRNSALVSIFPSVSAPVENPRPTKALSVLGNKLGGGLYPDVRAVFTLDRHNTSKHRIVCMPALLLISCWLGVRPCTRGEGILYQMLSMQYGSSVLQLLASFFSLLNQGHNLLRQTHWCMWVMTVTPVRVCTASEKASGI